jgi:predicted  nucleic acid-binding Zn-ribbon protein
MAHPVIEEFTRVFSLDRLQVTSFRRMQRILRDEVQPMLDERDRLLVEVADLRAEVEKLKKQIEDAIAVAPNLVTAAVKRGRA